MKKLFAVLISISILTGVACAASFSSIGYIDVQKVFTDFKETDSAQKELEKQEESFKKDFEESQEKLEKAENEGKSEAELEKMKNELEEKLSPKRESLLMLNQQLTAKLQLEIVAAVKTVAKKVGIDIVVDKQVIITGGMDLTELVVNELNK